MYGRAGNELLGTPMRRGAYSRRFRYYTRSLVEKLLDKSRTTGHQPRELQTWARMYGQSVARSAASVQNTSCTICCDTMNRERFGNASRCRELPGSAHIRGHAGNEAGDF